MTTGFKTVFLFSGQGSQYSGMGRKLAEQHPVFRHSLEQSDAIIRQQLNRSLIAELHATKQDTLDDLLITHPAIVAVEIAMYEVLRSMDIQPDYLSGNSLGEFAAAVAGGVWSAEVALEAAIEQAKAIVSSDAAGGMLAVIHERKDLEAIYLRHQLFLAADNFEGHFTLSGSIAGLKGFQEELDHRGIHYLRLPVNHPFHAPLIENGRQRFQYYTAGMPPLSKPQPGFISGIQCRELTTLPEDYFWEVIRHYTNFSQIVTLLEEQGPCLYIDLGPSGTAATFVKYNLKPGSGSHVFPIMTPYQQEIQQLEKLQQWLAGK
ncbi:acyltransferase domain-containing protein [Chitinophaga nivalis]|uniref:Acyltransferase domain-containing protein n=1 Tax=Chitinophaga nivalis TaxID=2991709 RepID=A0ABT3IKR5_9BACT|nr:acyltransferase domain-containing protein [Chitinophaga nivalis]MCW3465904.1 acyltransferase domain-containing protein [Chitinophaga nivalis]MCW3484405.1 acyltransferase domain-containing protein [Chitinophaga nivalis]